MLRPTRCLLFALALPTFATAQDKWPLNIETGRGVITIYQPQPESYENGRFSARAAISATATGKDPVFGAMWMNGFLEVDRDSRMGTLTELKVTDLRFPSNVDTTNIKAWKEYLSGEIPNHTQPISIDRVIASLESEKEQPLPELKHDAPEIIYANTSTVLVYIDGDPKFQTMEKEAYERVVNTPYFIARIKDRSTLYLGASQLWYSATAFEGPWKLTTDVPKQLQEIAPKDTSAVALDKDEKGNPIAPNIVVRTKPAELVQTKGLADMKPIQGTQLLYVTNTDDDIFMDIASQQYYILVSGRWYKSAALDKNAWTYVPGDQLPKDFAQIPEGTEKENVLVSVPGTKAAKEAVMDAQIPQTAKVDRTATITVKYDGEPKWKLIEGTAIYEAENSSTTVLYIREHYHACDNGVWYDSNNASGPWKVSTEVPKEVKDIPPSSPSYNVKYVYVYESTPEVVYVGYTPGYMGCYVYGPTVVYGTGYYYNPWYGAMYYPRPCTWGFSMHYNPWMGWSMGVTFSTGFFSMSFYGGGYHGGWWGCPAYHPPYYGHHGGYHGGYRGGGNTINIDNSNNINVDRGNGGGRGGGIYDRGEGSGVKPSRPSQQPSQRPGQGGQGGNKPSQQPSKGVGNNNVLTDKSGNVYRDKGNGNMQQMDRNGNWQNTKPATSDGGGPRAKQPTIDQGTQNQLNRDMQNRQRGQQRTSNYQQNRSPGGYGGGGYGGSRGGGGGRMGGGGGRGGGRR